VVADAEAYGLTAMQIEGVAIGQHGQLWASSLARTLWRGALPTTTHQRATEMVALWWGPLIQVEPGDIVTLLPTSFGQVVEAVTKPYMAPAQTQFLPTRVW